MSTKSREVIWQGAKIRVQAARNEATKALRAADRAEAEAWSVRREGYGGPAQPSPTIAQCLNGSLRCLSCGTRRAIEVMAEREITPYKGVQSGRRTVKTFMHDIYDADRI